MNLQNFLFFHPKGSGEGGTGGTGDGGPGDATHVAYNHPTHGQISLPVMTKLAGGVAVPDTFSNGEVDFDLVEITQTDGSVVLAAHNVRNS